MDGRIGIAPAQAIVNESITVEPDQSVTRGYPEETTCISREVEDGAAAQAVSAYRT